MTAHSLSFPASHLLADRNVSERNCQVTEISRRKSEVSRVDEIRQEMSSAVRLLGEDGRNADEANERAARRSGLSRTIIERLRWKKMKRVPADVADAVRDALAAHEAKREALVQHELFIAKRRIEALERSIGSRGADFNCAGTGSVRQQGG